MSNSHQVKKALCMLFILALAASGCGRQTVAFEVRKTSINPESARKLMRQAKTEPPEAMTPEEYASARTDAIDSFVEAAEEAGADSSSLRKALVLVMPAKPQSQTLPRRVIQAPFGKKQAWIIIQNWGRPGQALSSVKVWAIDVDDQSLLYAVSER